MTDEQTPASEPMPNADPPPLAPLVEQAGAPAAPPPVAAAPAAPPPPVAWSAPPAAVAAAQPVRRSGLASAAGIVMLVLGVLGLLVGVLAFAGTAFFSQLGLGDIDGLPGTDAGGLIAGAFAFVAVIVISYSLAYVIGGIGVLRSRGWGRVIGIVLAIISGLIWLGGLTGGNQGSSVLAIIMLGLHVYVFVALAFFWRVKTA